ncbi:unnamed protein product [Jaminaea pallidilutea]
MPPKSTSGPSVASPSSQKRLYVGNLHPSVSDYELVQLLTPYGKFSKLDIVFHKTGPNRGKPKGFAFVEFTKPEDALGAQMATDGKAFKGGRNLHVRFAHQHDEAGQGTGGPEPVRTTQRYRSGGANDASANQSTTTLSLIKKSQRPQGTQGKIAAMEAKLKALQEAKEDGGGSSQQSPSTKSSGLNKPPQHAGLPRKPSFNSNPR